MKDFLKNKTTIKRTAMVLLFFAIIFGLWEIIAPMVSGEWASFIVYVVLLIVVIVMFRKELVNEWRDFKTLLGLRNNFFLGLLIALVVELALSVAIIWIGTNLCPEIMPVNNENVKNQMASVPLILTVLQGCIFAPIIEETTFRYSIIYKPARRKTEAILAIISIIIFDSFHIVAPLEFFYYLAPSIILTLFYFFSITNGRDTKDYEKLIQWSEVFLRNKSFTTFSGKKSGNALLFPMEQVFEAFVARWINRIFTELSNAAYRVSAQDRGYFLFDSPRKFRLRPDIVVRKNGTSPVVMDTKWKRLKPDAGINYGISQSDMYQMYAYSKKYHTSDIWLLYPLNEDVKGVEDISFVAEREEDKKVNVRIFFIDLADYKNSITRLYDAMDAVVVQRDFEVVHE